MVICFCFATSCSSVVALDATIDHSDKAKCVAKIDKDKTITVMQWNIGHFSKGKKEKSTVSDMSFTHNMNELKDLLSQTDPDIISLNEYSLLFADTQNHPKCAADTLFFSSFPFEYIGNNSKQRHYCLNAVFSRFEFFQAETKEYDANRMASYAVSNGIKPEDYYFIQLHLTLFGEDVTFVSTHLAFDKNDDEVTQNQVKELIKVLEDKDHIIICGDFNTMAANLSLFTQHGYTLANDGALTTYPSSSPNASIDNIIVKGFDINCSRVIRSSLSDHLPIVCEISMKTEF